MIKVNPISIKGDWDDGYALDMHTISSDFIGYDDYNHYQNERTPLGELLYQLKYHNNVAVVGDIADVAIEFIRFSWKIRIDLIIPVPPSNTNRPIQPVEAIVNVIGWKLGIPILNNALKKIKDTRQLQAKNITDQQERTDILKDAFQVVDHSIENKNVLLFDDLYGSGTTLKIITNVLKKNAKPNRVYVLTCTKKRASS